MSKLFDKTVQGMAKLAVEKSESSPEDYSDFIDYISDNDVRIPPNTTWMVSDLSNNRTLQMALETYPDWKEDIMGLWDQWKNS